MWQIYQGLVFCVTCSILSYLLFPASVALVVCGFLALLFLLNDYILWRYLSVHVASIYYWIVSVYNFLANMYHQSNNTNGPDRRYIDSSGTSGNNIGLYRKNNPNPNYNLISSYSLRNESGLSKSFQSPLKSLRYSIDSSLSDSTRGENDSNIERFIIPGNVPRSKSSLGLGFNSRKYQHQSSDTTRTESQQEAGLLTPSTRFNLNLNPKLYADINSPGFCSRVAEKLNESMTHQAKYSTVGSFPIVNLNSKSHKPHLSYRNSRAVTKTPVRVRIAPPDMSLSSLDSSILRHTSIGSDESMKSVLQVLREISRKRIHSQENEEDDDNTKRIRTSEFEDVTMEEKPSSDQLAQGKRPREDSPRNEEVKRQRRQFRNNEILSSLSSSMTIQPPHLVQSKKRKAQNGEELQAIISTQGKLLKFQTTPTPPSTPEEVEKVSTENKQQMEENVTPRLESLQETPKLPITEIPNLKKVVVSDISPLPKATTLSNTESLGVEIESVESPRLFGRFSPSKIDGVKEDNDGQGKETGSSRGNETGLSKLIASPPKEQMSRLQDMLSSIDRDYNDSLPMFNEPVKSFLNSDEPKKIESTETTTKIGSFNSIAVTKPSSGILSVSSPGEKLSKSVSFSDPIAVTKVISDSESTSSSASSIVNEKSQFKATTHNSVILPMKDGVGMKESGGLNLSSPSAPILKTTSNLSSGFILNKTEQNQTFSSSSLISATAVTTSASKSSINFNVSSASSSSPKSITSFNSTSVANNVFSSSPSTLTNSLDQTSMALPITQTSSPNLISPFAMSATNVTSVSQTKPSPSISFSGTSAANPITAMKMFNSVITNSTPTTSEAPNPVVFSFTSPTPKTQPENTSSSVFGTNASQSFSLPSGNTMFGNSIMKSSSSALIPESKSVFSVSSASETITKPSFVFGSGNTSDLNQNKPMFGKVFGTVSSTTTAAEKTSSSFGNVFNTVSTTQSNPILSGFGNTNKTTPTVAGFAMATTQQSTPNMFSTPSTNSLQNQSSTSVFDASKTNLQKTESSGNVFGSSTTNPETKTDGFGSYKPATNGFAFTPVATSSSNIFGNVFSGSTPTQSSPVSKPTPSFVGFGTPQVTASTTPSPFSFGSTAQSNQSSSVFGSVPTTTATTALPVFSFGSNSTTNSAQSSSVFRAPMNSTPQTNLPFGSASAPQTTLPFGAATLNSTTQTTAFGINSTHKTSSGFGITPNSSQTSSAFGVSTTNATQPTNPSFNSPAASSGFPSLTNGTGTNTSSAFGSTFGALSGASPFTFGGSTTNPSGFTFGGASATSTSPAVGFGTPVKPVSFNVTPSQPTVNPPPNVFAFGQQPAASPASTQLNFQFNAGSTQPSPGGFHFNPAAATPPNAFQIGAVAPAPTTMFTLGSGSSAGSSTSRLKAIPRVRRQK